MIHGCRESGAVYSGQSEEVGRHCLEASKQQVMLCVYICDKRTLKDNLVYISDWGW